MSTFESLGDRRAIRYPARDGKSVPAYLTLPAGREPKGLPLVLLVHGGPHARDTFTFDWWASFLASRGYAVLQPNFRGSTGYGYDWFNAGRGAWGDGVMQTDVEDGAAALVKAGMVDASRVCIMGASYGGYAALAGAVLTPDRYSCAVSVNGLSDPERLMNNAQRGGRRSMTAEWWKRSMGQDQDHLRKISPARNVEAVKVPVLILHGENDTVVEVEQSRSLAARLKEAGKRVHYVEMAGDDHWLSTGPTRTQMLKEIEAFLAEHLAAGPKAVP